LDNEESFAMAKKKPRRPARPAEPALERVRPSPVWQAIRQGRLGSVDRRPTVPRTPKRKQFGE
jgi:hypothetical protein